MSAATRCRIFVSLIGLFLLAEPDALAGPFEEANAKYRSGDFKGAAEAYREIMTSGEGTAAVSYNLGNALLRSGKKAQALLAYERALQADPRSRDIRWNIGVVESALTDRAGEDSPGWLAGLRAAAGWISIDETAWALLGLTLLLASAGWAGRTAAARALLAGVLFTGAFFAFQLREEGRRRVVVTDSEVVLRYGPAFSETKAFVLHEGASADVLDESGDWLYVQYGKNAGWLPKKTSEEI